MIRGKLSHIIGNIAFIGSIGFINIPYIPTFTIEEFMYLKTAVLTFR